MPVENKRFLRRGLAKFYLSYLRCVVMGCHGSICNDEHEDGIKFEVLRTSSFSVQIGSLQCFQDILENHGEKGTPDVNAS